jgi:hypothetical protein
MAVVAEPKLRPPADTMAPENADGDARPFAF